MGQYRNFQILHTKLLRPLAGSLLPLSLLLVLLLPLIPFTSAYSFTLNNSNPPRYKVDEIKLDFVNDNCSNSGYSAQQLFDVAMEAMDEYWNQVPTTRLKLVKGSLFTNISANGDDLVGLVLKGEDNHIIMGCNDDIAEFATGSVVGVGYIFELNTNATRGALLINAHANSRVSSLSRQTLMALIAHEVGHALGLGHSSDEVALMYYSLGGKVQEQITEDDYDGISYLYPQYKKLSGLAGSCATVNLVNNNDDDTGKGPPLLLVTILALGLVLMSSSILRKGHKKFTFQ